MKIFENEARKPHHRLTPVPAFLLLQSVIGNDTLSLAIGCNRWSTGSRAVRRLGFNSGVNPLKKIILFIILGGICTLAGGVLWVYLSLPNVGYLKSQNPKATALIDQRLRESRSSGKPATSVLRSTTR